MALADQPPRDLLNEAEHGSITVVGNPGRSERTCSSKLSTKTSKGPGKSQRARKRSGLCDATTHRKKRSRFGFVLDATKQARQHDSSIIAPLLDTHDYDEQRARLQVHVAETAKKADEAIRRFKSK